MRATSDPMPQPESQPSLLYAHDRFVDRHVGPSPEEITAMAAALGLKNLDQLIDEMNAGGDPELFETADQVLHTFSMTKVAGAWVDPETGRLTVGVTDQAIESTVASEFLTRWLSSASSRFWRSR